MGETSKFRDRILWLIDSFIDVPKMTGADILDIGSGDDPLIYDCHKLDLPSPYTKKCDVVGLTYKCDARIADEVVNRKYLIVYSSHLLEDFPKEDTIPVLKRWSKLVEKDGLLILLLPDQQRYLAHCKRKNEKPNEHHSIQDFSVKYVKDCIRMVHGIEVILSEIYFDDGEYNFMIMARKKV